MRIIRYCTLLIIFNIIATPCLAEDAWKFNLTSETKKLIESPFFLIISADLNKNGKREIIAADFGRFGNRFGEYKEKWWKDQWNEPYPPNYNLLLLEWDKSELKLKWKKQWDMKKSMSQDERRIYFSAYRASQFAVWSIGDRVIAETIPAFLGLEWVDGQYLLREQHDSGSFLEKTLVGSWALPWLNPACYSGGPEGQSTFSATNRECIVGIRDFSGKGRPKIVTIITEDINNGKYKQTLKVRGFEPGFPVEWETAGPPDTFLGWRRPEAQNLLDLMNWNATGGLLISSATGKYFFWPEEKGQGYSLIPLQAKEPMGIVTYDLPGTYLSSTQKKGIEEYWGYHRKEFTDPESINYILLLKRVLLKPDLSGFTSEVIEFPHHENFLGVGYFDLKDIDNDGLDEIILTEQTAGKFTPKGETLEFSKIKDYIHILKWDGKEYKTMWVSPPYTKRGTKFLIEDVKNTGKKQLVVMTPNGTIQIWERE